MSNFTNTLFVKGKIVDKILKNEFLWRQVCPLNKFKTTVLIAEGCGEGLLYNGYYAHVVT
jgi:hypothetical protein